MEEKYFKIIKSIVDSELDPTEHKAFIFGSFATGDNWRGSDVDVGLEGVNLDVMKKIRIEEKLENSTLPYVVQVVDFNEVDQDFLEEAKKKVVPINY